MYWHDGMGAAGWWGIGFGMLILLGIVIAGLVLLIRWAIGNNQAPPAASPSPAQQAGAPPPDPRRILDERFARGEIDEDEYRRRRDALQRD